MDHFFLIERHLAPMLEIAESLGDDRVNVVPDLPGGNSAYQLVFHSCGMLEWWTRTSILGQRVGRDRAAEFTATGTIATLRARVAPVEATAVRLGRILAANTRFRSRILCGVTSTSSSSLMNSIACSRPSLRGGINRTASSAVDARILVCFFSLVMLTSMSLARAFSPTIMPS